MMTLQRTQARATVPGAGALFSPSGMNSVTLEHYLKGLNFPSGKREIISNAEVNGAPENIMAFFINRLPARLFRSASDVSFTVFTSSFLFGQD